MNNNYYLSYPHLRGHGGAADPGRVVSLLQQTRAGGERPLYIFIQAVGVEEFQGSIKVRVSTIWFYRNIVTVTSRTVGNTLLEDKIMKILLYSTLFLRLLHWLMLSASPCSHQSHRTPLKIEDFLERTCRCYKQQRRSQGTG